jgi:hypothetical protein
MVVRRLGESSRAIPVAPPLEVMVEKVASRGTYEQGGSPMRVGPRRGGRGKTGEGQSEHGGHLQNTSQEEE